MSTNQRRSRDERQPNPAPIRLMNRDIQVLKAVYEFRLMTTQQIQRLFFPSMHQAYHRLAKLYDHAYLDRRFMGVSVDRMNSPLLYVLDERGADVLRSHMGMTIKNRYVKRDITPQFLEHAMGISDVRVAITRACQEREEVTLDQWIGENDLKSDYDYVVIRTDDRSKRQSVIPDSYFRIALATGTTHFFLELDRGTMDLRRFQDKVLAYTAYREGGLSKARFGTSKFRVLTVTESPRRMTNLKAAAEAVKAQSGFWFAVRSQLRADNILNQPVWQVAQRTHPTTLLR